MPCTEKIVIENDLLKLVLNGDCTAESLIFKKTGEECLVKDLQVPFFSLTEPRPFNNEIKLAHPNKKTTFNANRVTRDGNTLTVGFELIPFHAIVEIKEAHGYIAFELKDFIVGEKDFEGLRMDTPPVDEFRLIQLPVKDRGAFGEWLNVCLDDRLAVNVLATCPYARIGAEERDGYRIMTADAVKGIKLKGCNAALIVSEKDKLLDCIDKLEVDYDLPRGVKSRRSPDINSCIYWVYTTNPQTIDDHIKYMQECGFNKMLLSYKAIFKEECGYIYCSDYDYRDDYPNGAADLKAMLDKLKAAGITPGLHLLHTHVGLKSRYCTPVVDYRLHIKQKYNLSKPIGPDDTTIYVEQSTEEAVACDSGCRLLNFEGEMICYEGFSKEYPYCFTGCKRGYNNTHAKAHPAGAYGGILDVSEYAASSIYIDQTTSLQDEVADKIAEIYNLGFEFMYFDGSEGTNPPFDFHVSNAQYRIYKKLNPAPLFCEGAAKSHFGWHIMSGGNAFDVFPPNVFKEKIAQFPAEEAGRMANDFTRLNFGWWGYYNNDFQPDMYEYGSSRAAAWNCPATMISDFVAFQSNPRTKDNFEVMKRWEDVRRKNWLTDAQKEELKNVKQEHILLINEKKEYELVPYDHIKGAVGGNTDVSAYIFERAGRTYVVVWHTKGCGTLSLKLPTNDIIYEDDIGATKIPFTKDGDSLLIRISDRNYLSCDLSREDVIAAFEQAILID